MSLFLIPTLDATDVSQPFARRTVTRGNSCGPAAVRSPFDLIFGGSGGGDFARHPFAVDDEEARYAAYEARLRHQQQVEEQRLQERYAALRRQAEIERERERRRIRAQQEQQQQQRRRQAALAAAAAAHAAWQEERERQVRAALARRQQEALAAAERQRAWQQQHRLTQEAAAAARTQRQQHSYDEQVAAAVAQEQWEQVAKQGLSIAFEFAKNLFGLDEDEEDGMQVDPQEGKSDVAGPSTTNAVGADKKEEVTDKDTFEDPPELGPTEAVVQPQTQAEQTVEQPQAKLVFTHPLPSDASQRAAIKADDIDVQYDDQSQSIVVRGLWQHSVDDDEAAHSDDGRTVSSSSDDDEQSRGRKRSRSPKRSRVSDVDEKTGEEIVPTDAVDADGLVNVTNGKGKQAQGTARIPVPNGASVAGLRAQLTDDGFQVWL